MHAVQFEGTNQLSNYHVQGTEFYRVEPFDIYTNNMHQGETLDIPFEEQ